MKILLPFPDAKNVTNFPSILITEDVAVFWKLKQLQMRFIVESVKSIGGYGTQIIIVPVGIALKQLKYENL